MSDNASRSVSGGSGSKNKSPPTKVSVISVVKVSNSILVSEKQNPAFL